MSVPGCQLRPACNGALDRLPPDGVPNIHLKPRSYWFYVNPPFPWARGGRKLPIFRPFERLGCSLPSLGTLLHSAPWRSTHYQATVNCESPSRGAVVWTQSTPHEPFGTNSPCRVQLKRADVRNLVRRLRCQTPDEHSIIRCDQFCVRNRCGICAHTASSRTRH